MTSPAKFTAPAAQSSGPLLDLEAAAAYLGVTPRWIRRAVAERRIGHFKLGGLLRFRLADLDALVAAGRREAIR